MAAVLYVALIVFGWAVLSVLLDREVIDRAGVPFVVGPAGVVVCTAVVFAGAVSRGPAGALARAMIVAAAVLVAMPLAWAVVLFLSGELPAGSIGFGARRLLDPFVVVAAVIGGAVAAVAALVRRAE